VPEPSQAETAYAFERLTKALKAYGPLPTEKGKPRGALANEFMYMQQTSDGTFQFKHADTRNYVFVRPNGKLEIPKGGSFMQGFFDAFHEEYTEFKRLSTPLAERASVSVTEAASFPWHLAAEADRAATDSYMKLGAFKGAMDQMEEIPADLRPYYDQTGKAIDAAYKLQQETHQLMMTVRKASAKYR
jgi:hypothetical protein